jgi:hypothetical protein
MQSSVFWLNQQPLEATVEVSTSTAERSIPELNLPSIAEELIESSDIETASLFEQIAAIAFLFATLSITLILAVTVKPFFLIANLTSKR